MKTILSEQDSVTLDELVAQTEKNTGTQVVLALIERCDSYEELPWKAFALGASLSGLLFLLLDFYIQPWAQLPLWAVAATLAGGAGFALLAVGVPGFSHKLLSSHRADTEIRQYAQSMFLERELFATQDRKAILVLVALFEKRIEILPDKGLESQLTKPALYRIIDDMSPLLKRGRIVNAFESGLQHLNRLLKSNGHGPGDNELPNQIIEEKGI